MKSLAEIYERYKSPASHGDKGTVHSYIEPYSHLLAPFRRSGVRVLEIGILSGLSLLMWEEYFSSGRVTGVDLNDHPLDTFDLRPLIYAGHDIRLLDATSREQIDAHFGDEQFDVVIDDASHVLEHQLATYGHFRHRMKPGSLYVIEDVADLDRVRGKFEAIDPERQVQIIDLRPAKNRFDDVLVVIRA